MFRGAVAIEHGLVMFWHDFVMFWHDFVMFWHEFFMFWHGLRHVAMDFGSVLEHGEVDFSDRCDSCSWERGLSKLPSGNCKLPRGIF